VPVAAARDRPGSVRTLPTSATRLIGICGKCSKKLGGGFGAGGDRSLAKALRRTVAGAKGKRALLRIVETKCLDICPKGAVAIVDSQAPGIVAIVARDTPLAVVCARLDLPVRIG
jgi:hypothetical protein